MAAFILGEDPSRLVLVSHDNTDSAVNLNIAQGRHRLALAIKPGAGAEDFAAVRGVETGGGPEGVAVKT